MKRKKPRRREAQKAKVLGDIQPDEAQEVLSALLKAHPRLREEAEDVLRSLNSGASSEAIADEVEWELLQEAIDPILGEMQTQLDLGLHREALETCKGLALGLYRVRNKKNDGCLGWAPDFPAQTATQVVRRWREDGGKRKGSFPRSFVDRQVPEWRSVLL